MFLCYMDTGSSPVWRAGWGITEAWTHECTSRSRHDGGCVRMKWCVACVIKSIVVGMFRIVRCCGWYSSSSRTEWLIEDMVWRGVAAWSEEWLGWSLVWPCEIISNLIYINLPILGLVFQSRIFSIHASNFSIAFLF